jgi:two-component system, OmpR family, sensor kinase
VRGLIVRLRRIPIRLKLTLVFAAAMAVVLGALGLFLYIHFRSGLDASLDQQLRARASEIASFVPTANLGKRPLRERGESFAQILDTRGRVVDASVDYRAPLLGSSEIAAAKHRATLVERHERTRLYALPIDAGREIVVVGASLAQHESALETFGAALVIGGPLALVLASLAGYLLAAAALRPVESMRRRAATISTGDLSARLPLPDSVDELRRLGQTLNEMLVRLEQGLDRERAFVADASHELRSPLAVLKGELEVALMDMDDLGQLRAAVNSAVEETDRIIALAEELLVLARAEGGSLGLRVRDLSATELLDALYVTYTPVAERAGRTLSAHTANGAWLRGDPERLRQALGNVIDNALRYGRGPISTYTLQVGDHVEIHVTDEGPGFPPDFLPHAFERFRRADPSRSRGGTGLGLAIVQAIAHAHHGEVRAANRPDGGADVWLTLPASSPRLSA